MQTESGQMAIAYFEDRRYPPAMFRCCLTNARALELLGLEKTESFWLIPTQDALKPEQDTAAMRAEEKP